MQEGDLYDTPPPEDYDHSPNLSPGLSPVTPVVTTPQPHLRKRRGSTGTGARTVPGIGAGVVRRSSTSAFEDTLALQTPPRRDWKRHMFSSSRTLGSDVGSTAVPVPVPAATPPAAKDGRGRGPGVGGGDGLEGKGWGQGRGRGIGVGRGLRSALSRKVTEEGRDALDQSTPREVVEERCVAVFWRGGGARRGAVW